MPYSTAEKRNEHQRLQVLTHPEAVYATRRRKQAFITAYKAERGCMDCGEKDVVVLELDHRNPAMKDERLRDAAKKNSGRTAFISFSWEDLEAELAKCDVVCANCHRRRTARQQGWLE